MIKISHELPLSLLSYSSDWNDYEYCLPHLLDKHADYRQFFLDTKERDRFIIMDNGLFEGVKHTTQDLLEKIDLIEPNIFIVPDEWNERDITAKNAKHWTQYKLPFKTKLMVVLQGKTVNEIHTLYQQCVDLGYTHFAFNHSSVVYQELGGSENVLANQSVGRVLLIEYLITQKLIKDINGNLKRLELVETELVNGKFQRVAGSEKEIPADLVFLALGFTGPEKNELLDQPQLGLTN